MKDSAYYEQLAAEVRERVLQAIPLARALAFEVQKYDGQELVLTAPLASNINDKGTAFAGSIATLAVLSGWYMTTLVVEERFGLTDVAAVSSRLDYKAPITGDLVARVALPEADSLAAFEERFRQKQRARLTQQVRLGHDDQVAAWFEGEFIARKQR